MNVRTARRGLTAALVATALSCSGGSTPSAPAPAPSTVVVASPSPSPASSPATPASPAAATCKYGKGTPDTFCTRKNAALLGDVDSAIDRLVAQHPEYFNTQDINGPGGYQVLKPLEFHQGVVAQLQSAGMCAETDTTEISVRNGADFSEDYDILLATGHVRRGQGSYRQTCSPPSFPLDAADVISYVRVAFYSIRCDAGITPPRNGEDKLPIGCTGFVTATPKTKDNLDVNENLIGNRIDWTLDQEGERVRVNDFPDVAFNKVVTAVNTGHWILCAEVKGIKGCQFGEVMPDPR
jgi:hypothetical protein